MLRSIATATCCSLLVVASVGIQAPAATLAAWTFETSPPSTAGPHPADVGVGAAIGVHASPLTAYTNPSGNGSNESWNSNNWAVGDYYQFQVSTLGESGIVFAWDQTRSSSGPEGPTDTEPNFKLQYSTDGVTFTDAGEYVVPIVTWSDLGRDASTQYVRDLSSVAALDNQPSVFFRLTSILPAQSANGQSRVDNITVSVIPEPTTMAMALVGLVVAAGLRRPDR